MKLNQTGIASYLILALIVTGIIGGTVLVQNGLNFLPRAGEFQEVVTDEIDESGEKCASNQSDARCEGTDFVNDYWAVRDEICRKITHRDPHTAACGGEQSSQSQQNPPADPAPPATPQQFDPPPTGNTPISAAQLQGCNDEACKNRACEADKVTYCDNREGKPRAIRKTGGYFDSTTGQCVFDFFEVPSKNSECAKSESKSGDVVSVSPEEERQIDKERNDSLPSRQAGTSVGLGADVACSTDQNTNKNTETSFKDAKVANNLVRFYSILEGLPNLCTPADLGVGEKIIKPGANGTEGRLMLCSKTDGSVSWRVIQGSNLEPAQMQTPNDKAGIEAFLKDYIAKALEASK